MREVIQKIKKEEQMNEEVIKNCRKMIRNVMQLVKHV